MTAMMSAGSPAGNRRTSAVAVAVLMVITTVLTPVMCVSSCLCTSFHRTNRTAGIHRRLSAMSMMPVSRNRHSQKNCQQSCCQHCCKMSAHMHPSPLLSSTLYSQGRSCNHTIAQKRGSKQVSLCFYHGILPLLLRFTGTL